MKYLAKTLSATALLLGASFSYAAPQYLITHNHTDLTAGAFVGGSIPPQHPTKPKSESKLYWGLIKIACFNHTQGGRCPALIKLGNNNDYPIEVGYVYLDLNTGDIIPKELHNNGYAVVINGLGEATISKDS